jgi:septal ring-binding cell division protein DamX
MELNMKKQAALIFLSFFILSGCSNSEPDPVNVENKQSKEELYPVAEDEFEVVTIIENDTSVQESAVYSQNQNTVTTVSSANYQAPQGYYTIQVIALTKNSNIRSFTEQLPKPHVVLSNEKTLNGQHFKTILLGEFRSRSEADKVLRTLPEWAIEAKAYVRSFESIEKSMYPEIIQLR